MEDFYTIPEFAEMFGVTERTVRNWIDSGEIVAYRVGVRLIRIDPRSADLICKPIQYLGRTSSAHKHVRLTSSPYMSTHIDSETLESTQNSYTNSPKTKGNHGNGRFSIPRVSNAKNKSWNGGDAK